MARILVGRLCVEPTFGPAGVVAMPDDQLVAVHLVTSRGLAILGINRTGTQPLSLNSQLAKVPRVAAIANGVVTDEGRSRTSRSMTFRRLGEVGRRSRSRVQMDGIRAEYSARNKNCQKGSWLGLENAMLTSGGVARPLTLPTDSLPTPYMTTRSIPGPEVSI